MFNKNNRSNALVTRCRPGYLFACKLGWTRTHQLYVRKVPVTNAEWEPIVVRVYFKLLPEHSKYKQKTTDLIHWVPSN